jgi:hypothetical protein
VPSEKPGAAGNQNSFHAIQPLRNDVSGVE